MHASQPLAYAGDASQPLAYAGDASQPLAYAGDASQPPSGTLRRYFCPNTLAGRLPFAYTSRKSQRYFHDRLQDAIGVTIMGGRARAAAEIS
ncbi:MAG: hypothetical protein ABH865_08330, partial [Candidatus Omnitrophota bacterium]